MNADLLPALVAVVVVVDWWAVASSRRRVELVAKPMAMLLLVVVAAGFGDAPADVRTWLVIGASFGVIGDTALLADGEVPFTVGLAAFALGHLAYVAAALSFGFEAMWAVPGGVFVLGLLGFRFVSSTVPGALAQGGRVLGGAVVVYALVISAMVVSAWATGLWLVAVGAMLFAISDWVLGYQRFVAPLPGRRLSVMIPYHVGQALLIVGLTVG